MVRVKRVKKKYGTRRNIAPDHNLIPKYINSEPGYVSWCYGILTVPSRAGHLFHQTLESLHCAGFSTPRVFVDGFMSGGSYSKYALPVTYRYPVVGHYGNWVLSMWELYVRTPTADRYVIFEDDILMCKNLREYLSRSRYPNNGYLNLYCSPPNEGIGAGEDVKQQLRLTGNRWYKSDQKGRGAMALVFSNKILATLLTSCQLLPGLKSDCDDRRSLDHVIARILNQIGIYEYVHRPSLVQHLGKVSSAGNKNTGEQSSSFPGSDYNALDLL